jgi:parafibromin
MATTTDEENIKETLVQWSSENALSEAMLSEDGQILTLKDTSLANRTLSVEFGGKSCQYTLASIYLQILDPGQGLLAYRNACKKHNVSDPVKALDKPTVVGYFVGASSAPAAAAVVPPPAEAAVAADDAAVEAGEAVSDKSKERKKSSKHESSKRKDKERSKRKESSGSSSKHRGDKESPKKKKPRSLLVTNEQLFSNLKDVVDKRQIHHETETEEEITKALSTQGFDVTPELLQEHKETTHTILANEIPVGDSSSILRAANPRKDLSRVLEIFLETMAPPKSSSSSKPSKPTSSSGRSSSAPLPPRTPTKSYLIGKKPVIVVPKGMTAPITLMNAHSLFCDSHFEPRDVLMKQGRHRNPPTTFTRNVRLPGMSGTSLVEYEIVDNPKKLGDPREWERIVAVVVLGQSWQFKDWPNPYNNPVHLFSRTLGFHISLEGDKIPPESLAWAIERGTLNRDKRGLDSVTYAKFWNGLDHFMSVHKRELLPQAQS